jgi:DNA polymerase-3 subunit delta
LFRSFLFKTTIFGIPKTGWQFMDEIIKIVNDIKVGNIKPIYFLMGEEPYYIDRLSSYIEENILTEEEKGFNQTVLYGRDVSMEDIISTSKRYPMMAERQVVIVKEAQDLSKTIDKLESYAENPMPSTVLVFCYKYKTLDKRKKLVKYLDKTGLVYESKKLYDNQVGDWIKRVLQGKNYSIEPKATAMLVEFLGTDLSKINNELEKLRIILPKGSTITPKIIEENIGFSKDYNVFELRKALGERNQLKAYQIAHYFAENPKDNPMVVTTSLVFSFFSNVLQYHGLKDKSPKNVASVLKVNPYFLSDYNIALKNYPMKKVSQIVGSLRDIDVKSKGVGANAMPNSDLLKEMLIKVFN